MDFTGNPKINLMHNIPCNRYYHHDIILAASGPIGDHCGGGMEQTRSRNELQQDMELTHSSSMAHQKPGPESVFNGNHNALFIHHSAFKTSQMTPRPLKQSLHNNSSLPHKQFITAIGTPRKHIHSRRTHRQTTSQAHYKNLGKQKLWEKTRLFVFTAWPEIPVTLNMSWIPRRTNNIRVKNIDMYWARDKVPFRDDPLDYNFDQYLKDLDLLLKDINCTHPRTLVTFWVSPWWTLGFCIASREDPPDQTSDFKCRRWKFPGRSQFPLPNTSLWPQNTKNRRPSFPAENGTGSPHSRAIWMKINAVFCRDLSQKWSE